MAVARKLCVLFWRLLTREEDYALRPTFDDALKIRTLALATGAKPTSGRKAAKRAPARHRGAHLIGPLWGSQRGGTQPLDSAL